MIRAATVIASQAVISAQTKSGTNEFHGSAYLFLRNESMNANSWINNYNGLARARNRNRTEGFTLGGPVYIPGKFNKEKNKPLSEGRCRGYPAVAIPQCGFSWA